MLFPACCETGPTQVRLRALMQRFPLIGLSFTACASLYRRRSLDMVLWLAPKSTATCPCFHPTSKWPMALAWSTLDNFNIFTDQQKFCSTPRTWMQNCTIWLTVSNNWVHWWPALPVSCGSLLARRDFGKFLLDPTSLRWAVSSLW